MAMRKTTTTVELPRSYGEAKERLKGRKIVFLPDDRMIIDYGVLTSLSHCCKAIVVVKEARYEVIYWEDGTVEHLPTA